MMKPVSPQILWLVSVLLSLSRNTLAVPSLFTTIIPHPIPLQAPLSFLYVGFGSTLSDVTYTICCLVQNLSVSRVYQFLVNLNACHFEYS